MTVGLDNGPLTVSAPDLNVGTPAATASGASYGDVAPDTDLRYSVSASGIKEELVLRSTKSPHSFNFHIADPSGQLGGGYATPDGGYRFNGTIDGDVAIELPPPVAYHASDPAKTATFPPKDPSSAHIAVSPTDQGVDVSVSVDEDWLASQTYPVILDPTLRFSDQFGTMRVGSTYRSSYCSGGSGGCHVITSNTDLAAGTFTNQNYDWEPTRSVFRFDLSAIPPGSTVQSADLSTSVIGCLGDPTVPPYLCNNRSYQIDLHPLTAPWDGSSTWNTLQSSTSSSVFSSILIFPFTTYSPPCSGCFTTTFAATSQVQSWVNSPSTNNGFEAQLKDDMLPAQYNAGGPVWAYTDPNGGAAVGSSYMPKLDVSFIPANNPTPMENLGPEQLGENCQTCSGGQPVNTQSGNFWHQFNDITIPGHGPSIHLDRTYNSATSNLDGPFSWGWSSPYSTLLSFDPQSGNAIVHEENGNVVVFAPNGSGGYVAPPRVFATLINNGNGYTFTRRNTDIFTFNVYGQLTAISDRNGYTTTVNHDSSFRLASVIDPAGRSLQFGYDPGPPQSNFHVRTMTDLAGGRSVTYTYSDSALNLTDVVDVNAGVGGNTGHSVFTYSGHLMLTLRQPRYYNDSTTAPTPVIRNIYDQFGRVTSQQDQLGRVTTFDYLSQPGSTIVTDPSQHKVREVYTNGVLSDAYSGYQSAEEGHWHYDYDPITLGAATVTDPNGHHWHATYDANTGNELSSSDDVHPATVTTYNAFNEPTSITDGNGVTTTLTYDTTTPNNGTPGFNLASRSTPLFNDQHQQIATQTTTYRYKERGNAAGDVTSIVDPLNKVWSYDYFADGPVASVTAPPTAEIPTGAKTTYTEDTVGRRTSEVSPRGNAGGGASLFTTSYTYDPDNLLRTVTDHLGNVTRYDYDYNRNLSKYTDGKTNPTIFGYDPANEQTSVTRADNTQLRTSYLGDGSVATQTDAAGNSTTYGYDHQGRRTSMTTPPTAAYPLGNTTNYAYDLAGNLVSKTDPGGSCPTVISYPPNLTGYSACTVMGYDAANQLFSTYYSDGQTPNVTSISYDGDGARSTMTEVVAGVNKTSIWHRDSLRRMTFSTDRNGATTLYGYDLRDFQTSVTYPGGLVVTHAPDDAGKMASLQIGTAAPVTFTYNGDGALATTTYSPVGVTDVRTYDNGDRLTGITDNRTDGSNTYQYGRDNNDQLTSVTTTGAPAPPAGDNHNYGYNPLNQLNADNGAPLRYDAADNLTRTSSGTLQSFDAANELTATAGAPGATSYGAAGDITVQADYDGDHKADVAIYRPSTGLWAIHNSISDADTFVTYGGLNGDLPAPADYDGDGKTDIAIFRPSVGTWYIHQSSNGADVAVTYGINGDVPIPADFDGDHKADLAVFRPSSGTWYVHPSGGGADIATSYGANGDKPQPVDFDGDGKADIAFFRPTTGLWNIHPSGGGSDTSMTYGTSGDSAVAGDYDGDHKADIAVFRSSSGVWYVHQSSNGIDTAATFGTTNDVAVQADYDADAKIDMAVWRSSSTWYVSPSTATTYGYDRRGNRISKTPSGGSSVQYAYDQVNRLTSAPGATFAYSGDSLRMSKTNTSTNVTGTYVWDVSGPLPRLLTESSPSGIIKYIYGPSEAPLAQLDAGNNLYYLHSDQLGSVRTVTSTTNGQLAASYNYDSYGRTVNTSGSTTTPFGFAGEYRDTETGLIYLRARYYDPSSGQFLSRDPAVGLTAAPYNYVANNPVNATDPSGACPKCLEEAAAGIEAATYARDKCKSFLGLLEPVYICDVIYIAAITAVVGRYVGCEEENHGGGGPPPHYPRGPVIPWPPQPGGKPRPAPGPPPKAPRPPYYDEPGNLLGENGTLSGTAIGLVG